VTDVGDDMEPGEGRVKDGGGGGREGGGVGHIGAGDWDVGEDNGGQQGAGEQETEQTDTDNITSAATTHDGLQYSDYEMSGYPELLTYSSGHL